MSILNPILFTLWSSLFELRPNKSGKPMPPHLPRCQGIAVAYYSFTLGRLEDGAPSTFAHLVYKIL